MSKFCLQLLIFFAIPVVMFGGRRASADEMFEVATQLYQSKQWHQAATAFERLAQNAQQDPALRLKAQLYAGESLVQLGKYAEARRHYQLVQHPPFPTQPPARLAAQASFRLGEVAWLAGDHERAARLLQGFVTQYPLDLSVSYAQEYLGKIRVQQTSQEDFAVLDEAVGWERDGRSAAALAAYHKLLKQPLGSQVRAETLRRTARLHDRLAQSREALSLYGQFLTDYPNSQRNPEVLAAVAWLYDRQDQSAQAADYFRALYAKFPQSAQASEAAYWLAHSRADKGESGQAQEYIDWLLAKKELSKDRPQLWGMAWCLKCQLVAAKEDWQQLEALVARAELDEGPLKTKLEFWAAEASFRLRKYDLARTRLDTLQPKTLGITEPWTAMVPLRQAQLAARRQQWGEVLHILDRLERDFPQFELNYEVDYLRGRALAGRGQMTAARGFYQRVLENSEATETEAAAMAGWMIGETYFHQRDYARARFAYQAVMEQTSLPEWQTRAALQAGKCWELEQHWDKASEVYLTALKRWPDSASDQELASRLRWAQNQQKSRKQ